MRVCIVYDCLYPYTIGGAERWYRNLAERLAGAGHDVTFLTLRQWERGVEPDVPGVRVVAVGPRMALYAQSGRRRLLPPIVFGLGVLRHLLRHGAVRRRPHCVVPVLLAARRGVARRRGRFRIVVDWHEVWTRELLARVPRAARRPVGWLVQRACLRVPQRAFCFSTAARAAPARARAPRRADAPRGAVRGGTVEPSRPGRRARSRSSRAATSPRSASRRSCRRSPGRGSRCPSCAARSTATARSARGPAGDRRARARMDSSPRRGSSSERCSRAPSRARSASYFRRDARATDWSSSRPPRAACPTVVVAGDDNAATELVDEGVNGTVAASSAPTFSPPRSPASTEAGPELAASTLDWFRRNAERLSLERSLEIVLEAYASV